MLTRDKKRDKKFQLRLGDKHLAQLSALTDHERDVPSKSEMVRRLIQRSYYRLLPAPSPKNLKQPAYRLVPGPAPGPKNLKKSA
jgi:hypothetical protein